VKEPGRGPELALVAPGRSSYPITTARLHALVTTTGLTIEDTRLGEGAVAVSGHTVNIHYTGWLAGGRKFDSSREREAAFEFEVDAGQVIAGWDEGVQGMKVGGKRRLVVPPHLGYGECGAGNAVPPNATLVFDVELLRVF
jgi:FKBP-type peptidyl-prolyl cis-trans isomerase FkpA